MAHDAGRTGAPAGERRHELYVTRASLPPLDEFVAEISPFWDSHMLTNMGEEHGRFQRALCDVLGVEECVLFANGHSALEAALAAFGLSGEVITTPFTFASTTHAIVRSGLTPVMCDVKADDATLDADALEALVTSKTSAIVPVHVYGNVCDVEAIQAVADRHGLKVVYDAAHAFGERLHGRSVASFGDAAVLSFHATKAFHSVEGGAVVCNDDSALAGQLELMRNFGIADEERVPAIGGNAKMSELHAAMGVCNLRHFADQVASRQAAFERYRRRLADVGGVRVLSKPREGATSNYSYLALLVDDATGAARDKLSDALATQGIHARKYFYPCTNAYACYEGVLDPAATPVAQRLSREVLCLPLFAGMHDDDVDRVCDTVRKIIKQDSPVL